MTAEAAAPLRAVVGVGANLGDRLATMRLALGAMAGLAAIERTSPVYETAPVGGPEQPPYLNAAVLLRYAGAPLGLLDDLLSIEANLGRVRHERWGPRTIDLDLLWIEGLAIAHPRLEVPHPRLTQRAFALVPLLDVVPEARDPRTGVPYLRPPGDIHRTHDTL